MKRESKYPTTQGHYDYAHIIPNGLIYIGTSGQQPSKRWQPSTYKTTSLQPYIEEFGWNNIQHVVLKDGLTKEQAEQLEDLLIQEARKGGWCINKQGSGGYYRDNPTEYMRQYRQDNPDYVKREREHDRKSNRYQTNPEYKRKVLEYRHQSDVKERARNNKRNRYQTNPEYREKIKERQRQYRLKKKQST